MRAVRRTTTIAPDARSSDAVPSIGTQRSAVITRQNGRWRHPYRVELKQGVMLSEKQFVYRWTETDARRPAECHCRLRPDRLWVETYYERSVDA